MKKLISFLLFVLPVALQAQEATPLAITIHLNKTVQPIRNIGASGCWFTEEIGATWKPADKQRIAELLFSKKMDGNGQPLGIGLSAFRYNIGAGTAEQGDSSGIQLPAHRVECFLSPDGTYDWNKQKGYTWMLRQAKAYGVKDLIAFVNSPPVQFTKNGLGFKLVKDSLANLKEDKYGAFADFMATVMRHFQDDKLAFNYISPVNEPQWEWTGSRGTAKQEGSPFINEEIFKVTKALNSSLQAQKLSTKILLTEAGMLNHLYSANPTNRSKQINAFWNPASPFYVGNLSNASRFVEGHGYFTDNGAVNLINTRKTLRDSLKKYDGLEYWQSEYCMLGDGYREGKTGNISQMDFALFLAKVIHHDFTAGNATAWHYWDSYEPGRANTPRYYLIAMNPRRATNPDTMYTVTKNLWALGHYSMFVQPGMYRVESSRGDSLSDMAAATAVMVSAFKEMGDKKAVVTLINYTTDQKPVNLLLNGSATSRWKVSGYRTTEMPGEDMKPFAVTAKSSTDSKGTLLQLPARSITTVVFQK